MQEISQEELELSRVFQSISHINPIDIIALDEANAIGFTVPKFLIGKAIGPKGKNVEILRKRLGKAVYIFSDDNNAEKFLKNLFNNVEILDLDTTNIMGDIVFIFFFSEKDKGKALGKNKAHIRIAKELLKKKFNASLNLKTKVL